MALRRFVRNGVSARTSSAENLGVQASVLGLETLDVAGIHAQALNSARPRDDAPVSGTPQGIERADAFFKATLVPIEAKHRAARQADRCIERLNRTLRQRTGESSASAERLTQATAQRKAAEACAGKCAVRQAERLAEAQRLQKRLRHRMRDILTHQEGERKRIGGELRDEIAQALLAIDLSLLALNTPGQGDFENVEKTIANAQRILQKFSAGTHLAGNQ